MTNQDIEKLKDTLNKVIAKDLLSLTLSKPLLAANDIKKITVKPVLIKEKLYFQLSSFKNNQAFHDNFKKEECLNQLVEYISTSTFGQLDAKNISFTTLILTNKKGTVTIKTKNIKADSNKKSLANDDRLNHNRTKQYILNEGEKIDFLMALGVMTPEYKIAKAKYDKFKQLNRYLEFVNDILPSLTQNNKSNNDKPLQIVDFGCGKSYLTFALYYYLKKVQKLNVQIIGLDLKEQVIRDCNALSKKLGYTELKFYCGDIKDYEEITGHKDNDIDMVITLHACDTATDFALYKAVKWNAKVIMAVPCCHKEMNRQLKTANTDKALQNIMKYGLIKERMASLMTDAYRANCLEEQGYDVQVMEFIDMEHTPKNILIRAVKSNKIHNVNNSSKTIEDSYKLSLTLGKLLNQ